MNSLVVVFPALPVTPTTRSPGRASSRPGQRLEGGDGVGDEDEAEVRPGRGHGPGYDRPGRAAGRGVGDEVVAVAPGDDGEEKVARARSAANRWRSRGRRAPESR